MPLSSGQEFGLFGIFGFPLSHTLSPVMQEAAFRDLGLKAFYLPFEVSLGEFRSLMQNRKKLLLDGFNVTVPYKEEILKYLDQISPSAKAIGAVNTVIRKGQKWAGFNTDEIGFIHSLERQGGFNPWGKHALLLGAGGSARAVAYGLARNGAKKIVIANRTIAKARKIASEYRKIFPGTDFKVMSLRGSNPLEAEACLAGRRAISKSRLLRRRKTPPRNDVDLVVNATSVGLRPGDRALVSPNLFHKKTLFVDLIYNPAGTSLLKLAKKFGHRTLNGLGMLIYQGAEAFSIWTGKNAPVNIMKKAITKR